MTIIKLHLLPIFLIYKRIINKFKLNTRHNLSLGNFHTFVVLFVCFVALRPKPTAMDIAGRSVHLTTLFPGQA